MTPKNLYTIVKLIQIHIYCVRCRIYHIFPLHRILITGTTKYGNMTFRKRYSKNPGQTIKLDDYPK